MWRRTREQNVTVVVDEVNVSDAMDALETLRHQVLRDIEAARVDALVEIVAAKRRLESIVTEAKAERARLETAVGTARTATRRGGRTW